MHRQQKGSRMKKDTLRAVSNNAKVHAEGKFPKHTEIVKQVWWTMPKDRTHPEHIFSSLHAHNPTSFHQLPIDTELKVPFKDVAEIAEVIQHYRVQHTRMLQREYIETSRPPWRPISENQHDHQDYCLVPKSRLEMLESLEQHICMERQKLDKECTHAFLDTPVSTRMPFRFVVVAVLNLCERRIATGLKRMQEIASMTFDVKEPYDNVDASKVSKKLKKTIQDAEKMPYKSAETNAADTLHVHFTRIVDHSDRYSAYLRQREYFYMHQEDLLTHARMEVQRIIDRKVDFTVYIALAIRFGPLSKPLFEAHGLPGMTYTKIIRRSLRKITKAWMAKWPGVKSKRLRSVTLMQTTYRCYVVRKKWIPVLKLYHRIQSKFINANFRAWGTYAIGVTRARNVLQMCLYGARKRCFYEWKATTQTIVQDRKDALRRFWNRMMRHVQLNVLSSWHNYAKQMHNLRRIFNKNSKDRLKDTFKDWKLYARKSIHDRHYFLHCSKIQGMYRGIHARQSILPYIARKQQAINMIQRVARKYLARCYTAKLKGIIDAKDLTFEKNYIDKRMVLMKALKNLIEQRRIKHELLLCAQAEMKASEEYTKWAKKNRRTIKADANRLRKNQSIETTPAIPTRKFSLFKRKAPVRVDSKVTSLISTEGLMEPYTEQVALEKVENAILHSRVAEARAICEEAFRYEYPPNYFCIDPHHCAGPKSFADMHDYRAHDCLEESSKQLKFAKLQLYLQNDACYNNFSKYASSHGDASVKATLCFWQDGNSVMLLANGPVSNEAIVELQQSHISYLKQQLVCPSFITGMQLCHFKIIDSFKNAWPLYQRRTMLWAIVHHYLRPQFSAFLKTPTGKKCKEQYSISINRLKSSKQEAHRVQRRTCFSLHQQECSKQLYLTLYHHRQRDALSYTQYLGKKGRKRVAAILSVHHHLLQAGAHGRLMVFAKKSVQIMTRRREAQLYLQSAVRRSVRLYKEQQRHLAWFPGIGRIFHLRMQTLDALSIYARMAFLLSASAHKSEFEISQIQASAWLHEFADNAREQLESSNSP